MLMNKINIKNLGKCHITKNNVNLIKMVIGRGKPNMLTN